jgi:glucokinase
MLLAGDIGGTKTLLGFFAPGAERPQPIEIFEFVTADYGSLEEMIDDALEQRSRRARVEAACFGVAGPVIDQIARLTNVAWRVDAAEVANHLDDAEVRIVNDLAAMAYAVPVLEADELAVLQEGQAVPTGNAALIAAGTGLGEALLHNIDGRFVPSPSEGGHADFAARTPREIELLTELIRIYGRAEYEHVVSGPGLVNLFRFTHPDGCPVIAPHTSPDDIPARLTASALAGRCAKCVEALTLFVGVFGAESGNLALRSVATAGIYLCGGIAPKILPALEAGTFLDAFRTKEPLSDMLATVPVSVVLNTDAGLIGAAVCASRIRRDEGRGTRDE